MDGAADLPSFSACLGDFRSSISRLRASAGTSQVPSDEMACLCAMLSKMHDAVNTHAGWFGVHPALASDFERGLEALQELQRGRGNQRHVRAASPEQEDTNSSAGSDTSSVRGSPSPPPYRSYSTGRANNTGLNEALHQAQQALALCVMHYCDNLRLELAKAQVRAGQVDQVEGVLAQMAQERQQMLAQQARMKAEVEERTALLELYQDALQEATMYEADVAAMAAQAGLDVWGPGSQVPHPRMLGEDDGGEGREGMFLYGAGLSSENNGLLSAGPSDVLASGTAAALGDEEGQGEGQGEREDAGVRASWGGDSSIAFSSSPRSGGASPAASSNPSPLGPLRDQTPEQKVPFLKSQSGWVRGPHIKPLVFSNLRSSSVREGGTAQPYRLLSSREGGSTPALNASVQPSSAAELLSTYRRAASFQRSSAPVSVRSSHAAPPTMPTAQPPLPRSSLSKVPAPADAGPSRGFEFPGSAQQQTEERTEAPFSTDLFKQRVSQAGSADSEHTGEMFGSPKVSHTDVSNDQNKQPSSAAPGADAPPKVAARALLQQITLKCGFAPEAVLSAVSELVSEDAPRSEQPRATDDTTGTEAPARTDPAEATANQDDVQVVVRRADSPAVPTGLTRVAAHGVVMQDAATQAPGDATESRASAAVPDSAVYTAVKEVLRGIHQVFGGYASTARASGVLLAALLQLPLLLFTGKPTSKKQQPAATATQQSPRAAEQLRRPLLSSP